MTKYPPPPPGAEKRRHPRFENLFASVHLARGDETLVLTVRNLSLGGTAVAADSNDLSWLTVGTSHEVLLFDAAHDGIEPVRLMATVVRRDPGGVAFMWDDRDPVLAHGLARLFEELKSAEA